MDFKGIEGIHIDKVTILLVWLFPIIFAIHDFEEIIVVEKWITKNKQNLVQKLPQRAKSFFEKNFAMKTYQFSIVVYVEFVIISFATVIVYLNGFFGISKWLYLGLFAVLFLHSFTHIGQAILLKRYTPGVLTSIFLLIPYGLWFYYVLLQKNLISLQDIGISIPVGVILFTLLFPALMRAASKY
ncbi:HXXEE domain-containing protein [Bacillus sp. FJAT-49736]|uniref:HXXEE domain-containing protein n=1 Tax=Bacillus sp. FJAT-49736 TaxID=2833582 RepID=UPI001BC9DECD|nr:HXXEE domain-containing protein [Bacillus sp. FJAT-49736]MBS4174606.1 HXXEE domain-containing protein [Bacillus sp. FJAT-49736]